MKTLILTFISIFLFSISSAQSWLLEKNKDGIQVYTSKSDKYRMKASKAEMTVNLPIEKLVAAVYKVENYKDWMDDIAETRVIERKSDNNLIYYSQHEAPWPASDRDIIVEVTRRKEGNAVILDLENRPKVELEKDGIVRIPIYKGYWKFTPTKNGVKVVLEYQTDPGGKVPDFLIQGAAVKTPYNMFEDLREYVKKQL